MNETRDAGPDKPRGGGEPSAKTSATEAREQARRTRGSASHKKSNGHARVNGHAEALPHGPRAASDDARGIPNAAAAKSAAAGTDPDACAEVAGTPKGEKPNPRGGGNKSGDSARPIEIPPGTEPLPADGGGFVDAMHEHVDLYLACARLVKSTDEKIAQRAVERLLEMKYGKGPSAQPEESTEIVMDIDSAVARRAAEGAKK